MTAQACAFRPCAENFGGRCFCGGCRVNGFGLDGDGNGSEDGKEDGGEDENESGTGS